MKYIITIIFLIISSPVFSYCQVNEADGDDAIYNYNVCVENQREMEEMREEQRRLREEQQRMLEEQRRLSQEQEDERQRKLFEDSSGYGLLD